MGSVDHRSHLACRRGLAAPRRRRRAPRGRRSSRVPGRPRAASAHRAREPLGERGDVARRVEALLGHDLGEPAAAGGDDRQPGGHRLERGQREDLLVAGGDDGHGGAGAQLGQLRRRDVAGERDVAAHPLELAALRAVAGDDERQPGGSRRRDGVGEALLRREPARGQRVAARGGRSSAGDVALHRRDDARAAVERGAELRAGGRARTCSARRTRRRSPPAAAATARARRRRSAASAREPRQLSRTPGSVLRPWQRVQSSPRVKHVPTAQTSR